MDLAEVRSLARGHVWSGQEAFQHGLVTALGAAQMLSPLQNAWPSFPRYKLLELFSITT